jgi:hypothetical protein
VPEFRFLLNTKVPDLSRYPLHNNVFVINWKSSRNTRKKSANNCFEGVSLVAPLFFSQISWR